MSIITLIASSEKANAAAYGIALIINKSVIPPPRINDIHRFVATHPLEARFCNAKVSTPMTVKAKTTNKNEILT